MRFIDRPQSNTGGLFVKLKDKESIEGVFRGDPREFLQHRVGRRPVECAGDGCELCEKDTPKFRFRLNFVTKENGAYVAKIYEGGAMVYDALKDLHSSDWDLEKTVIRIARKGEGLDTEYSVTPKPGGISAETEKLLSSIKLNPLEPQQQAAQIGEDENIPF